MDSQQDLPHAQGTTQCYVAVWMGGEFGGEGIHVYLWLVPLLSP